VKGPGFGTGAICKNDDLTRLLPKPGSGAGQEATPQAGRCGMSQNCNRTVTEAQRCGQSDLCLWLRLASAVHLANRAPLNEIHDWEPRTTMTTASCICWRTTSCRCRKSRLVRYSKIHRGCLRWVTSRHSRSFGDVRYSSKSRYQLSALECPLWATTGLMRRSKTAASRLSKGFISSTQPERLLRFLREQIRRW